VKNAFVSTGAVVALLLTSVGAPAVAAVASDVLQVGTEAPADIVEGVEPGGVGVEIPITEPGQSVTGTETILLDEPGTSSISDIVQAIISNSAEGFFLTVNLTSDGETPLTFGGPVFESIPETGAVQDLTDDFTDAFDLNTSLPTITVMSDIDGVPEPSTWAMMLVGFGLLGLVGMRKTREAIGI
jgi:hypothetical protein